MKKFFTAFFVVMGVIFTTIILIIISFIIFSSLTGKTPSVPGFSDTASNSDSSESTNGLSSSQADALKSFGIDPSVVSSISPEQEACFTAQLGAERVAEIKAGATPSAGDFFNAKSCL
jgi:hypothetical protein